VPERTTDVTHTQHERELIEIAREFYLRGDSGSPDLPDLFSQDAEIYFPKFGIARGRNAVLDLAAGLMTSLATLSHRIDELSYVVSGNTVVVEGTTTGSTHDGGSWDGGKTPGGRFCSVFEIADGLISRMYIYLDPDYTGADAARFVWEPSSERRW
jgi:ketosteroid isomerase-like protein